MNAQQKRFVEEYCIDCNGAAAARRAGYAESGARQRASELLDREDVAKAVQERLAKMGMSAEEATKHIVDIARTRLNDYLVVQKVLKTPMVRKPLQQLINELDTQILFEDEFAKLAEFTKKEKLIHDNEQAERKRKALRYALLLEWNPDAYDDVPGEAVYVDQVQVDLAKLARAQDQGRIKSISFTEFGPKVELYPADAALNKVLEIQGKVKGVGDTNVVIFQLPDNGR